LKQQCTKLFLAVVLLAVAAPAMAQVTTETLDDSRFGALEPIKVLEIMERAVLKQDFQAYRAVLADSFVYAPDVITEAMYPDTDWSQWGIPQEEEFLRRFLSSVLEPELHLTDEIDERGMPMDHRARFELTYLIKIEGRAFISEASFHFVESDGNWYLWKWEEQDQVTNPNGGGYFSNSGAVRAALTP